MSKVEDEFGDDRARHLARMGALIRRAIAASPADRSQLGGVATVLPAARTVGDTTAWMPDLRDLVDAWLLIEHVARTQRDRPLVSETSPAAADRYTFRREGQYWTICYEADVFRLRDSKGLRYLGWLLEHVGREVCATDLVCVATGTTAKGVQARKARWEADQAQPGGLGDAGPHLDAGAKRSYRRRLGELRTELEEARECNDLGRVERFEHEREWLTRQLALGEHRGCAAYAASATERARVNVKNNLTTATNAIRRFDVVLWRHLFNALKTGTMCVYAPEKPVPWRF